MLQVMLFMPWLYAVCLVILLVAAFLHWQRTRHWCLLTLATGSFLVTAAIVGQQVLRDFVVLPSGAIQIDTSLRMIWDLLIVAGVVVAIVGGVGTTHWAIGSSDKGDSKVK